MKKVNIEFKKTNEESASLKINLGSTSLIQEVSHKERQEVVKNILNQVIPYASEKTIEEALNTYNYSLRNEKIDFK